MGFEAVSVSQAMFMSASPIAICSSQGRTHDGLYRLLGSIVQLVLCFLLPWLHGRRHSSIAFVLLLQTFRSTRNNETKVDS